MDIINTEIYNVAEAKKLLKEKGSKICIDIGGDGTWCYLEKSDWISRVGTGKYFVDYDGHLRPVNWSKAIGYISVMYVSNFTSTSDNVDPDELQDLNLE